MSWILENKETILFIITSIISVAAGIAAMTPNESDNKAVAKARAFVDLLAFNFGGAKNEKKSEKKGE